MAPRPQRLTVSHRAWALTRPFTTAHGTTTATDSIVVEVSDGDARGRGEAVPLARFGESVASVLAQLDAMKAAIASGLGRDTLPDAMPPGAARNALDCAFWDLDANRVYQNVADLGRLPAVKPVTTAFTLAHGTPENMAEQAAANPARPIFRLELGGAADIDRVRAVRQAAPTSRLIIDANEGWSVTELNAFMPELADLRVELIEQPLPADADGALVQSEHPIALCADESCRTLADLDRIEGKYSTINIRLDKVGGLTAAIALAAEANRRGLQIMVSGVRGTSLGVAPALFIAQQARFIDLDGPLHLAFDRGSPLRYDGSTIHPPSPNLWGGPA